MRTAGCSDFVIAVGPAQPRDHAAPGLTWNRNDWRETKMILQTHRLRDAILLALAASTTLAGTGVAFSQDPEQQATPDTTTLHRIADTGSCLQPAAIDGTMPITTHDPTLNDARDTVSPADSPPLTHLQP